MANWAKIYKEKKERLAKAKQPKTKTNFIAYGKVISIEIIGETNNEKRRLETNTE